MTNAGRKFAADEREGVVRGGFVRYQLDLARAAVLTGAVGPACAALWVLLPEDFETPDDAAMWLSVVRDMAAAKHVRLAAVMELLHLRPCAEARAPESREATFPDSAPVVGESSASIDNGGPN